MVQPGTLILVMAAAVLAPLLAHALSRALALYASTCLPLVVAITTIGVDEKVLRTSEAAALVAAAMISVLVFPLLAQRARAEAETAGTRSPRESAAEEETW